MRVRSGRGGCLAGAEIDKKNENDRKKIEKKENNRKGKARIGNRFRIRMEDFGGLKNGSRATAILPTGVQNRRRRRRKRRNIMMRLLNSTHISEVDALFQVDYLCLGRYVCVG